MLFLTRRREVGSGAGPIVGGELATLLSMQYTS